MSKNESWKKPEKLLESKRQATTVGAVQREQKPNGEWGLGVGDNNNKQANVYHRTPEKTEWGIGDLSYLNSKG